MSDFQNALAAHQARRHDEARAGYNDVLQQEPRHADALHLLGLIEFDQGDLRTAEGLIRQAIAITELALYRDSLGSVLTAQGTYEAAEAAFRRAIELAPVSALPHYNLGVLLLRLRREAAAETEFRRAIALQSGLVEAHLSLGALLADTGRFAEAEATFGTAIAVNPSHSRAHRDLGRLLFRLERYGEAEACYVRATKISPDDAQSHSELASVLVKNRRFEEAAVAGERALAINPQCVDAHINLGVALLRVGRLDDAEVAFRNALSADPDNSIANANLGGVLRLKRKDSEAIYALTRVGKDSPAFLEACQGLFHIHLAAGDVQAAAGTMRTALAVVPTHAESLWNLSLALLLQGEYDEGWRLYEARTSVFEAAGNATPHASRPWQGESLQGRSLVVHCEQGFGDTLQFCRYLPMLKALGATRVTVVCPEPLHHLLDELDDVEVYGARADAGTLPSHDFWCRLMSLPLRFGTTLQTIPATTPYLRAPANRRSVWMSRLPSSGFKVGLVWAGDPRPHMPDANLVDKRRSIHARDFLPLLEIPDVTFVSLQFGATTRPQLDEIDVRWRPFDPMGDVADFADTAAIVDNLDLVISVDTSTAHLAGALNKPVWILSRFDGCWRWMENRDDSPWYPSVRLFRQRKSGHWDEVIARVAAALEVEVSKQRDPAFDDALIDRGAS